MIPIKKKRIDRMSPKEQRKLLDDLFDKIYAYHKKLFEILKKH